MTFGEQSGTTPSGGTQEPGYGGGTASSGANTGSTTTSAYSGSAYVIQRKFKEKAPPPKFVIFR